jgi:hypothetical protein
MSTGKSDVAARIVKEIVADLTDRRGLRQEWDAIDSDIKREILVTWRRIVREELSK